MLNILKIYELRKQVLVPAPLEDVFSFFSKAENLNLITPPWLHFKILTPSPIKMEENASIDYSIKIFGFGMAWKSKITVWQPPHRFTDLQMKGPYRHWEHTHIFEEKEGNTYMEDVVRYAAPGFVLSPLLHFFFIRPRLEKIFVFRETSILEYFGQRA